MRVFYGGARSGNVGGPLVKVQRLNEHFPNTRWRYDLLYLLSNAPYLPGFALALIKQRGIPIVLNQNGVFYPAWFAGDWQRQNERMATGYRAADHVFYQSAFSKRCCDEFLGPRTGASEVLYNAIDTKRFLPGGDQAGRRFRFLHTGKIGHHMAYRLESVVAGLASAVASGLDAELVIAGAIDPDVQRNTRAAANKAGIADRITLRGSYTQSNAPAIYADADAYVTMTFNDVCPNAVLEALSCGLPVVHSASGGVGELVSRHAGIGVECAQSFTRVHVPEPDQIGAAMVSVAENRVPMAEAARARAVERFDITQWIARHRQVFGELLGQA